MIIARAIAFPILDIAPTVQNFQSREERLEGVEAQVGMQPFDEKSIKKRCAFHKETGVV
jgi:hypothetical protein